MLSLAKYVQGPVINVRLTWSISELKQGNLGHVSYYSGLFKEQDQNFSVIPIQSESPHTTSPQHNSPHTSTYGFLQYFTVSCVTSRILYFVTLRKISTPSSACKIGGDFCPPAFWESTE